MEFCFLTYYIWVLGRRACYIYQTLTHLCPASHFLARLYEVQGESYCSHPSRSWSSFMIRFFKSSYLDSHSSESIHIWTVGTLEVGFDSTTPDPRVHALWWGKRSEPRTAHVFFYFSVMKTTYANRWSDISHHCDIDFWAMKWRSAWPIFHGPMILPYILKTICCMNTILWDYESVWANVWPKIQCRSLWSIFHGSVILPYILKSF